MDQFQYFPTPPSLAAKMWRMFKNRSFERVLEPSAGRGDLARMHPHREFRGSHIKLDVMEIDARHHEALEGLNVIGFDFFTLKSAALYSHVIMNPSFSDGVKHVLHAWDIVWDAEIVAVINAESLKNPYTAERKRLANLIGEFGEVEYLMDAFLSEDALRQTGVEVALIHLTKKARVEADIYGDLLSSLRQDEEEAFGSECDFERISSLAIPENEIENAVRVFNAAVIAMRDSVRYEQRSRYYSALLGDTLAVRRGDQERSTSRTEGTREAVRREIGSRYDELKDRAWTHILTGTRVADKLSHKVRQKMESEFETIKKLEFTVSNVYGFLLGLVEKQGELQIDMALDVFSQITQYHSDNAVYYAGYGWKSNDKHRAGMKIRKSRFVIPGHKTDSWSTGLGFNSRSMLADFDKVFSMLDGKSSVGYGMVAMFEEKFDELRNGQRCSSDYFDCRFYPGKGTIHFFARDQKLVDRLNLLVGRHYQWLPPEGARVPEAYWLAYNKAEVFDKELREAVKARSGSRYGFNPHWAFGSRASDQHELAAEILGEEMLGVLEKNGIDLRSALANQQEQFPLLEAS